MDSGNNSGCSMQSSSGGDDQDFDHSSRGESVISSFFNPSSDPNLIPSSNMISTTPHDHHHQYTHFLTHQNTTPFFDHPAQHSTHTNNLHTFPQSNRHNSMINDHDLIWPNSLRSGQHSYPDFDNSSSAAQSRTPQSLSSSTTAPQQGPFPSPASPSGRAKNPKKRSRASRRAPTTVLTTDTTNFRQMVQEFTGIPAGSPYNSRRQLDLFSAATLGPLYQLSRPNTAHNVLYPFSSSPLNPTMVDNTATTTTHEASTSNNNSNDYSNDHLLNLQRGNASMGFGDLSGFQGQETRTAAAQMGDNDHLQKQ